MAVNRYLDNTVLAEKIQLASGQLAGASFNHKFGATPAMSQNQSGSVWDLNDTFYPWSALDTPAVVNIERNDIADNGLIVTVQGLDENWDYQAEDITITGADQTGTKLWRRVNRAFVSDGTTNTANIDIEAGAAGGTTIARITAGKGQTLMAVYTIPRGKTGYIMQGTMTVKSGADATGDMFVRYEGQTSFRIGHSFEVAGSGGQYFYPFSVPIRIPSMSDIDVRAAVRSNNARVTASFDVILLDNKLTL